MMIRFPLPSALLLGLTLSLPALADLDSRRSANWHQWRGPDATGVAPEADPPVEWSESRNVRWKVEIPGRGSASPIVWEDRVFVLTAEPTGRAAPSRDGEPEETFWHGGRRPKVYFRYWVLCLDRETGKERWRSSAVEAVPHEPHHPDHGYASASPTTDGKHVWASFGSRGIFCLDMEGDIVWSRDLGDMRTRSGFGEGASPVLHEGALVVNWDHEDESFIVALDARTGETRWRRDRDEVTSWSTPLVVETDDVTQVIVNATRRVTSYDLATGKTLWECGGQTVNVIPSPVVVDGLVLCVSGYRGSAAFGIPLDARGDISDTDKIAWKHDRGTPYVPSPLLYDGLLFFTKTNSAILTCLDARSGKVLLQDCRLPGLRNIYASPVGAAGRVYVVSREGVTLVIKRQPELEVLATNELSEGIDASPAVVGDSLFLRGERHLYRIAPPRKDA